MSEKDGVSEVESRRRDIDRNNEQEIENPNTNYLKTIGSISDLYHENMSQPRKSPILCNNVGEIKLIPNHNEVKIGALNISTTSSTLNTSRAFKKENSRIFQSLFLLLLHLFYDAFEAITKEDAVLQMIGNILHFLPSTCSCKSEKCKELQQMPSPITKSSQLNKFFVKSDELKSEFLKNIVKVLDWIFRKSKLLNEGEKNIETLKEAQKILEHLKTGTITKCVRNYALKWISFSFSEEKKFEELESEFATVQNEFLQYFLAVLVNTPFKETDKLRGQSVPVSNYLKYGCILKAAFNYIIKNHRVRARSKNCKCCVCTSTFSPEDLELIFLENVCSNPNILKRNENLHKIENLLSCIDRNDLMFYKKNSGKLMNIFKKIEKLPRFNPVERRNGKRKSQQLNSNINLAKHSKINDCEDEKRMTRVKDKSEGEITQIPKQKGFDQAESPQHMQTIGDDIQLCASSPQNIRFLKFFSMSIKPKI